MMKQGSTYSLSFERAAFTELRDMVERIFPDCLVTAEKGDALFRAYLISGTMGFVHIGMRDGGWRIVGIGVKEGSRGNGYGTRILDFAIDLIRRMGGHRITVLVDRNNATAIRMYARAGFRLAGKHKSRLRMALVLNN
jgi:ribosomal protein S18 acetylase RimI-like enzyme